MGEGAFSAVLSCLTPTPQSQHCSVFNCCVVFPGSTVWPVRSCLCLCLHLRPALDTLEQSFSMWRISSACMPCSCNTVRAVGVHEPALLLFFFPCLPPWWQSCIC